MKALKIFCNNFPAILGWKDLLKPRARGRCPRIVRRCGGSFGVGENRFHLNVSAVDVDADWCISWKIKFEARGGRGNARLKPKEGLHGPPLKQAEEKVLIQSQMSFKATGRSGLSAAQGSRCSIQDCPQRLKPSRSAASTARLKPCPSCENRFVPQRLLAFACFPTENLKPNVFSSSTGRLKSCPDKQNRVFRSL
jgi:hypothetical protein